jgi:hypothetical protein
MSGADVLPAAASRHQRVIKQPFVSSHARAVAGKAWGRGDAWFQGLAHSSDPGMGTCHITFIMLLQCTSRPISCLNAAFCN